LTIHLITNKYIIYTKQEELSSGVSVFAMSKKTGITSKFNRELGMYRESWDIVQLYKGGDYSQARINATFEDTYGVKE